MNVLIFAAALKVLAIGNSFSVQMVKAMPPVAQDMGLELDICSLYIGGCSFERHWKNVCDPTNRPYRVTRNAFGKEMPAFGGNIPEMLRADKWDVVTIQQASHFSWQPDSYHPFGDNLVKTVRELAPQAKIVVQETWSYTPWDRRLAKWGIDQNEMYAKLHAAYAGFAKQYGFEVIPTGTAVQLWRKELPVRYAEDSFGGDVCGRAKFLKDGETGKVVPKGDVFHMNAAGNHLQALVWTAKLFGVDVTACKYRPEGLDGNQVALMRKVAMKAVKGLED